METPPGELRRAAAAGGEETPLACRRTSPGSIHGRVRGAAQIFDRRIRTYSAPSPPWPIWASSKPTTSDRNSGRLSHCGTWRRSTPRSLSAPIARPLPVMTSTNVRPSRWARCKKPDSAWCARACVMPCRSSRASISFRPRESCKRSRRPSGASSGGAARGTCGFGARRILVDGGGFGEAAGFAAAGASVAGESPAGGFAARCFLRSGLVCFATLSHNARSSSLRLRFRRGYFSISSLNWRSRRDSCGRLRRRGRGAFRAFRGFRSVLWARNRRCLWQLGAVLLVFLLILEWINLRKQLCDFLRRPRIRQRHLAASRHRIEALRHQDDEAHIVPEPAGHPPGLRARAEIEIGARRTYDRRSRVLRDHQPAKWRLRLLRLDRQFAFDKKWRAVDVQCLVDRDRSARRQRDALRANRFILVRELHFAKEHVGPVLPPQFLGAVWILIDPFPDLLHRHLLFRDDAAVDQDASDRRIGISIMRVVIDAYGRAVVEPDPRRALDLREQQIGLTFKPADFQASAGNRAVFHLGPIVIGNELATADLANHLPLIGQPVRALFDAADEQIRRTAIDRHGVGIGLSPGPVDDRLVIAGDEAVASPEPRDAQGKKMFFEKSPSLGAIGKIGGFGRAAGIAQRNAQCLGIGGGVLVLPYSPRAPP